VQQKTNNNLIPLTTENVEDNYGVINSS